MKRTTRTQLLLMVGAAIFGLMAIARAQEAPPQEPAAPPVKKMTLMNLIAGGGWAMWPLGLCSFGMITMAAVNFQKVNQKKLIPPETLGLLKAAAKEQDFQKLWTLSTTVPSLFTNALAAGLRHINPDDPAASKPAMEEAIAEAVGREETQISYWINFLSLITAISPMVGLLGTVSGMIGAFQKIGAGGMGKPELLAGNIGEALITTATGLIIAIPAMFFYFFFRNSLNRIIQQAEEQFSVILDELTGTGLSQVEFVEAPEK